MDIDKYLEACQMPIIDHKVNGTVFHYTPPEGLLGILNKEGVTLWFSKYDCLNDASEGKDIVKQFKAACNALKEDNKINDEFFNLIVDRENDHTSLFAFLNSNESSDGQPFAFLTMMKYDTFVCCFSAKNDLLPMWNYYSKDNSYQGYNIGLKTEMFEDNRRNRNVGFYRTNGYLNLKMVRVLYDDTEKQVILKKRIMAFCERYKDEIDKKHLEREVLTMLNDFHIVFKDKAFKHEEELRAILYRPVEIPSDIPHDYSLPPILFRPQAGMITPYIAVRFYKYSDYFRSVMVGPLAKRDIATSTVKVLLKERGYRGEVLESKIPIRY